MTLVMEMVMANISFGTWMVVQRRKAGISQGDLAKAVGVARQSVSKWENGQATPALDFDQVLRFCEVMQTDLETAAKALRGEISID